MAFVNYTDDKGCIMYCKPKNDVNSQYILGMDLDWTLIRPINGKIFPRDENDWQFMDDNISKIRDYITKGYKFVIFTNQGGLLKSKKGKKGIDMQQFKSRWTEIEKMFKIKYNIENIYLIVSLYDDYYRKPCIGMWDFVEKQLNGSINVNKSKSLYVGDMAGRKKDYSYTDLMFSINLNVPFQVPEVFYNSSKLVTHQYSTLLEKLNNDNKIFIPDVYKKYFETHNYKFENTKSLSRIYELLTDEKMYLFLYVGCPGSGKSSFLRKYFNEWYNIQTDKKLKYMSFDNFEGTKIKFKKEVMENMKQSVPKIIIDSTNGTLKGRNEYIKLANDLKLKENINYNVIVIYFDTSRELALHLNSLRSKENNICELQKTNSDCKKNIPVVAINTYMKKFELPRKTDELFDDLITIHFEPIFHNTNNNKNMDTSFLTFEKYNQLLC